MATETPEAPSVSRRPRPVLLILLAVVLGVFLLTRFWGSAGSGAPASEPGRAPARGAAAAGQVEPERLDVKLETLESERPGPAGSERNPFRFQARPAPMDRPPAELKPRSAEEMQPQEPAAEQVPAIPVKFLGTMDMPDGSTLAVITDCSQGGRRTKPFREGEPVFGQYRLVKIGLQSVVIEHLDGRGRTTLPKTGQDCVWK